MFILINLSALNGDHYLYQKFLAKREVRVKNINLFIDKNNFEAFVRIRYRATPILGEVKIEGNKGLIKLKDNVFGVAKGQFAVFYDKDGRVLGAGEIE